MKKTTKKILKKIPKQSPTQELRRYISKHRFKNVGSIWYFKYVPKLLVKKAAIIEKPRTLAMDVLDFKVITKSLDAHFAAKNRTSKYGGITAKEWSSLSTKGKLARARDAGFCSYIHPSVWKTLSASQIARFHKQKIDIVRKQKSKVKVAKAGGPLKRTLALAGLIKDLNSQQYQYRLSKRSYLRKKAKHESPLSIEFTKKPRALQKEFLLQGKKLLTRLIQLAKQSLLSASIAKYENAAIATKLNSIFTSSLARRLLFKKIEGRKHRFLVVRYQKKLKYFSKNKNKRVKRRWVEPRLWAKLTRSQKDAIRNPMKRVAPAAPKAPVKFYDILTSLKFSKKHIAKLRSLKETGHNIAIYNVLHKIYEHPGLFSLEPKIITSKYSLVQNSTISASRVIGALTERELLQIPQLKTAASKNSAVKRSKSMPALVIGRSEEIRYWSARKSRRVSTKAYRIMMRRYRYHQNQGFYRMKVFRKFFRRQFGRFRHIGKNRLFIELFRGHFKRLTGFGERELMALWLAYRRGANRYWGYANLVRRFSQAILLMPHHVALFLNLAPTLSASRSLVKAGAVAINGLSSLSLKGFVKPGDIIQFTPGIWELVKLYYSYQRWTYYKAKISQLAFLQVDWSMLMFSLVHWPQPYELVAPSFLSERWIRYYIRQFPVRVRKYQKVKMVWKKYLSSRRKRK